MEAHPRQTQVSVTARDPRGNDLVADVILDGEKIGSTPLSFQARVCARELKVVEGKNVWRHPLTLTDGKPASYVAVPIAETPPPWQREPRRPQASPTTAEGRCASNTGWRTAFGTSAVLGALGGLGAGAWALSIKKDLGDLPPGDPGVASKLDLGTAMMVLANVGLGIGAVGAIGWLLTPTCATGVVP